MVVEIKRQLCDGQRLKWLMAAGLSWLEYHQDRVNKLNVFPVPDGDTGTNMRLTLRKAYSELESMDDTHVGVISEALARGALMGARGNSGVILSQLLQGFSQGLRGHELFDASLFAYAFRKAVNSAYDAVIEPVEGTILTVSRKAAEAVEAYVKTDNDLIKVLDVMLRAAQDALEETPEQLPLLKKAGVVDSGGQGLVFILEGMSRLLRDEPIYMNGHHDDEAYEEINWENALEPEDEDGYGYDVQFLIRGAGLDVAQIRAEIDAMGWSTLVVGDESLIKVHVHVHNPGEPLSYAIGLGAAIDDVVVENMQQQYEDYVVQRHIAEGDVAEPVAADQIAVITVSSGDGLSYVFRNELGVAHVITGGQTMNPSTEDFLDIIEHLDNERIILLPNNKNIILAAEQAAKMARGKEVRVVPSKTIPQGISAMFAYTNFTGEDIAIDDVHAEMVAALDEIFTAEVTTSTRDVELDKVKASEGQLIGLVEGKLVTAGEDLETLVIDMLIKAQVERYELITLYHGATVSPQNADALHATLSERFADQEFEVVYGGQPLYPYLISLE